MTDETAPGGAGDPASARRPGLRGARPGEDMDEYTFEQLVEELELLTDRMAAGDIGIEEAADLYEQAQQLHALAEERLRRVQERIEQLTPPT